MRSHSIQFPMRIRNISRRLCSSDYAQLGHFTFLFCRGRQKSVQRFITHVHSYSFAHHNLLFADDPVAFVVVVCLIKFPITSSNRQTSTSRLVRPISHNLLANKLFQFREQIVLKDLFVMFESPKHFPKLPLLKIQSVVTDT